MLWREIVSFNRRSCRSDAAAYFAIEAAAEDVEALCPFTFVKRDRLSKEFVALARVPLAASFL
jgi:hypothetical protein